MNSSYKQCVFLLHILTLLGFTLLAGGFAEGSLPHGQAPSRQVKPHLVWQTTIPQASFLSVAVCNARYVAVEGGHNLTKRRETRLFTLKLASGKLAWAGNLNTRFGFETADEQNWYVVQMVNPLFRIMAIDWKTGKTRWQQSLTPSGPALPRNFNLLLTDGQVVWVAPNGVIESHKAASGKRTWSLDIGHNEETTPVGYAEGRLYLHTRPAEQHMRIVAARTGRLLQDIAYNTTENAAYEVHLFWWLRYRLFVGLESVIDVGHDFRSLRITRSDLHTLWQRAGESPYGGPNKVELAGDTLICADLDYLGRPAALIGLDPETGKERWRHPAPAHGEENLIGVGNRVAVVERRDYSDHRHAAVYIGLRPRDGAEQWSLTIPTANNLGPIAAQTCGRWLIVGLSRTDGKPATVRAYVMP